MTLRRVVGIIFPSMQRVFGNTRAEPPALRVNDRNAHAERAKIHARHYGHELVSELDCTRGIA
jgi:hypothetical protein